MSEDTLELPKVSEDTLELPKVSEDILDQSEQVLGSVGHGAPAGWVAVMGRRKEVFKWARRGGFLSF